MGFGVLSGAPFSERLLQIFQDFVQLRVGLSLEVDLDLLEAQGAVFFGIGYSPDGIPVFGVFLTTFLRKKEGFLRGVLPNTFGDSLGFRSCNSVIV